MTKKRMLFLAVAAAAMALIGALLVFLLPSKHTDEVWIDASAYDTGLTAALLLQNPSAQQEPVPLPRFPITAPEGWEQLTDSARFANRYSQAHSDLFYREYRTVRLSQSYAADQTLITLPAKSYDTLQLGGREVICYTEEGQSGAVWVAGDHLLQLSCSGEMSREELLDWVEAVEEQDPQLPQTCPLEFVPGYMVQVEREGELSWELVSWRLGGNPEPGELTRQYVFEQPPKGFSLVDPQDGESTGAVYQNQAGDSLTLENLQLSPDSVSLFNFMSYDSARPKDPVEPVTVQGKPGLLYLTEGRVAVLVWLEETYFVRLTYEGGITSEQMLALAEGLVEQPRKEEGSSLSPEEP